MYSSNSLNKILFTMCLIMLLSLSISAQPPEPGQCESEVAATELDDICGFLCDKIFDYDTDPDRKGIEIDAFSTGSYPNRNAFLRIGLDTTEVGSRTWWDGLSDFTWTFDGSGSQSYDPKMEFKEGGISLSGQLEAKPYIDIAQPSFHHASSRQHPRSTGQWQMPMVSI